MTSHTAKPWYREPWPWLLMLGPFIVVIAGIVTAWLAVSSSDGLVAEDYYKQGLAVNKTLASSALARTLGLKVTLRMTEREFNVGLVARDPNFVAPASVRVTLSHPTRAGLDQSEIFERAGALYAGKLRLPRSGHWLVLIEDEPKTWRLMGKVELPASGEIVIAAEPGNASAAGK